MILSTGNLYNSDLEIISSSIIIFYCSLITHLLNLAKNCLSFDFIGTSADESTDDISTVQLPTNWRPAFLELDSLKLFFDLYHVLPARLSNLALSCLVQVMEKNEYNVYCFNL